MQRPSLILALCALLAACGKPPEKPPAPQARVEAGAVIFEAASPQLANLKTAEITPRRDTVSHFSGRLVWDEDRTARVFTPFSGRVLSIAVRPGDAVRAGQELAVLASPEIGIAQADARKSEQDHALAQKNLARVQELHGAGVAPAKDLQLAQADEARAAAERTRTLARLKTYGMAGSEVDQRFVLRTPVAGVVVERQLNPGQELRPDASPPGGLFVVSDPSQLWFLLDVAEAALGAVRPGQEVELSASALGGDKVRGRVVHVADVVDPQTRSVKVRGTVPNAARRLKAEMYVTAEVHTPAATGLVVPTRAVYLRGEKHFVFAEAGTGRFERREVKLGPTDNGHQVVLEGLKATDRVVVEGNLLLEKILSSRE